MNFVASMVKPMGGARLRLGLRGSLLLAFGVIAAMTIVISGSGNFLLSQLGHMMADLNDRELPRLTASLELAALSESLSAKGPSLLVAPNEETRQESAAALTQTQAAIVGKLKEIKALQVDPVVLTGLEDNVHATEETMRGLGNAAKERLEAAEARQKQYDALLKARAAFMKAGNSAMEDARGTYTAVLSLGMSQDGDAAKAARVVESLSTLMAESNMMIVNMASAFAATEAETINDLQLSFKTAADHAKASIAELADDAAPIRAPFQALLALGEGKTSAFKVRQKELDALDYGRLVLEETGKLNRGLGVSVRQLVTSVRNETNAATDNARGLIFKGSVGMLALGGLTIIGSILFVWLYVGGSILRRIATLQHAMLRLSDGDLETEIGDNRRHDEIGAMAGSLAVFRDGMARARNLDAEREKENIAKAQRTERIEARIRAFEDTVRQALTGLIEAADTMQATAQAMTGSAAQSSELASAVAAAAEETSVNVQTISSGTEELSSSIAEIGRQVTTSTQIAGKAVTEALETDANMQGLAENASRITVVVDLIQTIASQTNLLALNATIEAARAGEAGRGFAVVASEVKSLADQTAKATEEIRTQIVGMQQSTSSAVTAIRHIGETITEINEVTTAIAAAVEEQGAATREIARNIQHASGGTSEVSRNIVGVSEASSEAGAAADQVLTASGALRREAEQLRAEIDGFLANIRAA
jgi:methyl-accepting chemotaxis protein